MIVATYNFSYIQCYIHTIWIQEKSASMDQRHYKPLECQGKGSHEIFVGSVTTVFVAET